MPFANQVSAGVQFCRQIMQSLGFISGVTGWQLKRNGDAQFNNVTLTGSFAGTNYVINADGEFFYAAAPAPGNLLTSITNTAGTDDQNNAYLAGFTSYQNTGSGYVAINLSAANQLSWWVAATYAGPYAQVGQISSDVNGDLTLTCNDRFLIDNPLYLPPGTPGMFGGQAALFASGGGNLACVSGGDGNAYIAGELTLYKTAAQTINTTGAAAVTFANGGPTIPVVAGAYKIRVLGSYLEAQSAGTPSFEIVGPATSNVEILTKIWSQAGAAATLTNRTTALNTPFTGPAMASLTRIFDLEGLIVFTAAGNVGLSALTSAGADTYNIQAGTFLSLTPVT